MRGGDRLRLHVCAALPPRDAARDRATTRDRRAHGIQHPRPADQSSRRLDEISPCAPTDIHETRFGERRNYTIEPEHFGMRRANTADVRGGTVEANLALASRVLDGQPGPARDAVLLNAGAGLYVAGQAESIADGIRQAGAALDSGRARQKMVEVAAASQRIKAELATAVEVA